MRSYRSRRAANAILASATLLAGLAPAPARADHPDRLDDIPLPPAARPVDQALQLELVVNDISTSLVVPVSIIANRVRIARSDLAAAGLSVPQGLGDDIALNAVPGVTVDYDRPNQRLKLFVPPAWLPTHSIYVDRLSRMRPVSSFGMLFNYDVNITGDAENGARLSAWSEARAFGNFGQFSLTGALQGSQLVRYDFRWNRSDDEHAITYEGGDLVTRSLADTQPVRMAGIQISRDFSVRPDIVTYPLPQFAGDARLPSAVDLYIDGYRATAARVAPGPFSVDSIPGLNGAGEATLTVTDLMGRRVTTTIPFYVSNDLLKPGLLDFSAAIGALRQRYGQDSFDYGAGAATAALRYGVSSLLTVEGAAEARSGHIAGSAGALVQLGLLGAAHVSYAISRDRGAWGDRLSIGYQYRTRRFSLAASHVRESGDFADLTGRNGGRRLTTVAASWTLDRWGNVGASYIGTADRRGQSTRLASATWSLPIGSGPILYTTGNYDIRQRRWSGALNLILPLGRRRGTAAASVARDAGGGSTTRLDYGMSPPTQGGLGGNATLARSSDAGVYGAGELDWRTRAVEARVGLYGQDGRVTAWGGASGSVVVMDGGVFPANRIADSFVLVSTNGRADVPVSYDNQPIGRTDRHGHVLVPWVTSYYAALYAIDPFSLPADIAVPVVEQRLAVARGSGAVLRFDVRTTRSGRVVLVDGAGKPLPVGAFASVNGGAPLVVGWDGLLFVEALADRNSADVTLPNGARCTAHFPAPAPDSDLDTIGPVPCR